MNERATREAICKTGKRLLQCQLNHGAAGNISVRLEDGTVLLTPTGYDLAEVEPDEIVKIDNVGNILSGDLEPTSEWQFHLGIFAARPDVNAIIHVHAPYTTAYATANIPVTEWILPEFVNTVRELPVVPYEVPHTKELADSVCRVIVDHDSVLIANHGSITVGPTLKACLNNLEISEFTCQVSLLCKLLGNTEILTRTKM